MGQVFPPAWLRMFWADQSAVKSVRGRVGGRGSLDVLGVGDDVVARGVLHGNLRGANLAAVARVEVRDGVGFASR